MEPSGVRRIIHPSRSDSFSIWDISDIHLGAAGCAKDHLKADIERIRKDPYSFWVGGGDYGDYIAPHDKRWNSEGIDEEIVSVKDLGQLGGKIRRSVRDLFLPIKDKCLGLAEGNHETKYQHQQGQTDGHAWLCTELGVPNLRYSAIFDLVFMRGAGGPRLLPVGSPSPRQTTSQTFRVCIHHGFGGSVTPGGKLNTLIKLMHNVDADIYFMGHVHEQKGQRLVQISANADCSLITQKTRIGVISGSYLKTYCSGHTSYGEAKGYAPTPLGAARVKITPETRELRGDV